MIGFSRQVLSNGLKVIHHYDNTTPFAVVNVLYNVGAKHEDPERTGFAHLFEHLMFGGTKSFPNFDNPLQEAGGENNAFTNNDYTNYYDIVPAFNIEIPMCLEADRMIHLDINKRSLEVQRKVVCEEFKENYINQPYGNAWHILRELVYEKHPYRWPTIGKSLQHIEEATLEDVQHFYTANYTPSNSILVIAGNIEEKNAYGLAEKWFGKTERKQVIHPVFFEPEQSVAKEKTVYEDVPLNAIFMAFKMPGRMEPGYYAADVITDILSNGTASRLHQKLVKETKAFVEAEAYISDSIDTGMFVIEGKISEGFDVQRAYELVWQELEKLKSELIVENELRKVKNKMLTYLNFSESSLLNRAIGLAFYELLGDAGGINKEEERFEAVSATAIQQFAQHYLTKEKSDTLFYLQKK
jgi:predicted Zn-dependent peptidase